MQLSIFDVVGPVMIGPSSSHTAGAAKLGRVATKIAQKPFDSVTFALSGSFAKTGKGHGTDLALIAGVLGLKPDDERIPKARELAEERGLSITFMEEDLDWVHENGVHITFFHTDGTESHIYGASTGGGRIRIQKIDEFLTEFTAEAPTLIFFYQDVPGMIRNFTDVFAKKGLNIAVMKVSRQSKGALANAVIEIDSSIPKDLMKELSAISDIQKVVAVDVS